MKRDGLVLGFIILGCVIVFLAATHSGVSTDTLRLRPTLELPECRKDLDGMLVNSVVEGLCVCEKLEQFACTRSVPPNCRTGRWVQVGWPRGAPDAPICRGARWSR